MGAVKETHANGCICHRSAQWQARKGRVRRTAARGRRPLYGAPGPPATDWLSFGQGYWMVFWYVGS